MTIGHIKIVISGIEQDKEYKRTTTINFSFVALYTENQLLKTGNFSALLMSQYFIKSLSLNYDNLSFEWTGAIILEKDYPIGPLTLVIKGIDNFGNVANSSILFKVTNDELHFKFDESIFSRLERIQYFILKSEVSYSSGEYISKDSIVKINYIHKNSNINYEWSFIPIDMNMSSSAKWIIKHANLPMNAPLGEYIVKVHASDIYGNFGIYEFNLSVIPAKLILSFNPTKEVYQVGFEEIYLLGNVLYPDDTQFSKGNVSGVISVDSYQKHISFKYGESKIWVINIPTSIFDHVGTYNVRIRAFDEYGNTGETEIKYNVSQFYLVISIIIIALSIGTMLAFILRPYRKTINSKKSQ